MHRALNLVSGDVGRIPKSVQAMTPAGWDDVESRVGELLTSQPNQYQSSFEFFRGMCRDLMIWGNSAAMIQRANNGEVLGLIPMMPQSFQMHYQPDEEIHYSHAEMGRLMPDEILHFRMNGENPLWGDSPVMKMRASLDLLAEQEEAGRQLWRTGGIGKVALSSDEQFGGEENVRRLQESFKQAHAKAGSLASPIVTQGGMKVNTIGHSLAQQEWTEAREYSIRQVAMMYGVPPQMLYGVDQGPNQNEYTQLRAYTDGALMHFAEIFAGEVTRKLLAPGERFRFDFRYLLRADPNTQISSLRQAIDAGIMTQNECREIMQLPALEGGDELIFSKNYAPGGQVDGDEETDEGVMDD